MIKLQEMKAINLLDFKIQFMYLSVHELIGGYICITTKTLFMPIFYIYE